ncbi:hypothetical protein F4779DRAFT_570326, partial [Xylariaceae sp. FL0662B]
MLVILIQVILARRATVWGARKSESSSTYLFPLGWDSSHLKAMQSISTSHHDLHSRISHLQVTNQTTELPTETQYKHEPYCSCSLAERRIAIGIFCNTYLGPHRGPYSRFLTLYLSRATTHQKRKLAASFSENDIRIVGRDAALRGETRSKDPVVPGVV